MEKEEQFAVVFAAQVHSLSRNRLEKLQQYVLTETVPPKVSLELLSLLSNVVFP